MPTADPVPAPRPLALGATLLVVGAAWGATLVTGKVAVSTGHHPAGLIFWQLALTVAVLGPLAVVRGLRPALTREALILYAGVALLGTLIPNAASFVAFTALPAGVVAIVIATVPMISVLLAALTGAERRPEPLRLVGVALGGVAMVLLLGPEASLPDPAAWPFVVLCLLTPLCYGAEGVFVKLRAPVATDPVAALLGASILGIIALAPLLAALPSLRVPFPGPFGAPEQAILIGGVLHAGCYWGYLRLVGLGGPVYASLVSYVVTLSGVLWGVALLSERHSGWIWAALAVMLAGMALVQPRR
ncbi:MAG TPA: DMT family transporter [Paracoccaceae bacterium]|nr:DMT family transporter [Paracoccaceae bacterium]